MERTIICFQAIMLSLLYLTLATRSIMLYVKEGVNPFVLGKGKKGMAAVIEYLFFIGLLAWSYEIVATVFGFRFHLIPIKIIYQPIGESVALEYAGMIITLIGYVIFLLSLIAFGKSWRVGIDKDNPGKLITNGIFSLTRNPIFVFLDLYFIGTALINPTIFFIGFALSVLIGIHYQILQEERFLADYYGVEYSEYRNRVRRYF